MADSQECTNAIEHIRIVAGSGDLAVAKVLIDYAVHDAKALRCSVKQSKTLETFREEIYIAYIGDRLRIAKDEVIVHFNGHAGLRNLVAASDAAESLGFGLVNVDGLAAAALFSAACQDLEAAEIADLEEDFNLAKHLRAEAEEFLRRAVVLDERVKELIKEKIITK
jgi:hypothetical protein